MSIINKMKRTVKKLELPKNFAEQLLNCQIQYKLSDKPTKETVKYLVELYSLGVEYYQSIRSHKYLYFQLKMNEVFMSASTIAAISEEKISDVDSPLKKKMKSNIEQDKIHAFKVKHKQQKMFHQVIENTKQQATVCTIKKIINDTNMKDMAQKEKLKKQLDNQDLKFKDKLERRKTRLAYSKSFTSEDLVGYTDTRDTLFPELTSAEGNQNVIKPIEVSFSSIINQNDSDQETDEIIRRKMSVVSNAQGKKAKSQMDLFHSKTNS